jgi:putative chitinase
LTLLISLAEVGIFVDDIRDDSIRYDKVANWRFTVMKFDHDKFFAAYKEQFGPISSQSKVDGIESLLTQLESDSDVQDERWAAYMFATVKHECADTWKPIEEFGKGKGRKYGHPVQVKGSDGKTYSNVYYGRGYVQLTWDYNYKKMSAALGMNDALLIHPELVMEPDDAYKIMSYGMRNGSFTSKKLADYIAGEKSDYRNARRIINGLDKADLIKGYAQKLEGCFTGSRVADL